MLFKHRRYARSFVRSFLSFVFSRCGRFISRKIIPFCLCFVVLGLSLTVPSFAASEYGSNGIDVGEMVWDGQKLIDGEWEAFGVVRTHESAANSGYDSYRFVGGQSAGTYKNIIVYDMQDLHFNHEYKMEFKYKVGYASYTWMYIKLEALGANNNVVATQLIFSDTPSANNEWKNVSFKFVPDSTITSGGGYSTVQLSIVFEYTVGYSNPCYITSHIYLNDEDDNTSLLNTILNWLSKIYHSIAGGTDREGVNHTGIAAAISTLGSNLSTWLTGVKDGIVNKLDSVKTSITNAIDGIEQWFIDLKDNLVDGLKSLFIPRDGYFAQKKEELDTFMTNHFGAVWQAPGVVVDFLRKLVNLQPSEDFTIQVPAIQFKFDINPFDSVGAQTYTLLEAQTYSFNWVNDTSHPVHYFYVFYKGFVLLILLFALIQYLMGKFDVIVSGLPNFERD